MTQMHTGAGVQIFVAKTIAAGLKLYALTGMQPNRHWTPSKMLAKATEITGVKFKRREYMRAREELLRWAEEQVS